MENLPEIAGLIIFILAGRLFLKKFKLKSAHWPLWCGVSLLVSVVAFVVLVLGVGLGPD